MFAITNLFNLINYLIINYLNKNIVFVDKLLSVQEKHVKAVTKVAVTKVS